MHVDDEDEELLVEEGKSRSKSNSGIFPFGMCACLSVDYYRPYFDVNTEDVVTRIKYAVIFCGPGSSQFLQIVRDKPDAYGPWWIATTLVFLMSVTSHLKSLLNFSGKDNYEFDFTVVTFAAMAVYFYLGLLALAFYLGLNYWLHAPLTLLQCACVVGYSLTIYVPISILCVLNFIVWPALLAAWVLSSLFAVKAIMPMIEHLDNQKNAIFFAVIVILNALFMLIVKLNIYPASTS